MELPEITPELQEKLAEFDSLKQQLNAVEKNLVQLEQKRNELSFIIDSLKSIKGQSGEKILVPIGSGVFVQAVLEKSDKLLVEVGSGVVLKKSLEEAQEILEKQSEEINKIQVKMRADTDKMIVKLSELEPEIMSFYQELQKPKKKSKK